MKRLENIILCQGNPGPIHHDTMILNYLNILNSFDLKYLKERDNFYEFYVKTYEIKPQDIIQNLERYNKWVNNGLKR